MTSWLYSAIAFCNGGTSLSVLRTVQDVSETNLALMLIELKHTLKINDIKYNKYYYFYRFT